MTIVLLWASYALFMILQTVGFLSCAGIAATTTVFELTPGRAFISGMLLPFRLVSIGAHRIYRVFIPARIKDRLTNR